jgi:ubiquinone/menaquinone biosynthesis C-methylase UbiE
MKDDDRGQVSASAAEVYDRFFVPALFQQWAGRVADAARILPGHRALDVACGTGVLARTLNERVGAGGSVVGLDVNPGMLAVARRTQPDIEWREGRAESLPFDSASFDAVASQFGLMFFENKRTALAEMMRVLRRGGHLAVAVWDRLENAPGYAAVTSLLERLFGSEAAEALRTPFALGNRESLLAIFHQAGVRQPQLSTVDGTARFQSMRSWIYTEIKGWTLADRIDEDGFERLLAQAQRPLHRFVAADGSVCFPARAHIVTAVKD